MIAEASNMSKAHVLKFIEVIAHNEAMQKQLSKLKPTSLDDVVSFADTAKFSFTKEELAEVLAETGARLLADEDLENVSGGAFPTAVNDQITDSVT
jgi:predicted ribosomally synthesized peptide with nif11-like leader